MLIYTSPRFRYTGVMFRNPVYDLVVLVPVFLLAGLVSFFMVAPGTHAEEKESFIVGTSTFPDPAQQRVVLSQMEHHEVATGTLTLADVRTSSDLVEYAQGVIDANDTITSVALTPMGIQVRYTAQKKLLGVMPLMVPATVHIGSDGSVIFNEPWYAAVSIREADYLHSALEVRVRTLLTSEGYSASTRLSPMTQAELLALIQELLG